MSGARRERVRRAGRLAGAAAIAAVIVSLVAGIPAAAKNETPNLKALPATATAASATRLAATNLTIDLCAKTNPTWDIGPATVPIWGFALDAGAAGCSDDTAQLPGPVLGRDTPAITAGDTLTINLTNVNVPENVSILIPGIPASELLPDTQGVAAGGSASYEFMVGDPGTFLYESGVQSDAARVGIPMGLYGALVVDPAIAGRAYDDPGTAYNGEAVLVLSEIDPALNDDPDGSGCAPDPPNCHQLEYAPTYWLINGEAYPDTDPIAAVSGNRLLLRYVNAGSIHHGMELLGAHQRVIAKDAFPGFAYQVVAETVPAGQTMDAITTACVVAGDNQLPLSNSNLRLTNGNAAPGGMLTFVTLTGSACASGDNIAPVVDAGEDQTIVLPASAALDGTVFDDFVTPVEVMWTKQSGPGTVTFAPSAAVEDPSASFSAAGTYVLRLTADDGVNPAVFDEVTITVTAPALLYFSTIGVVSVGPANPDDADIYAWKGGSNVTRIFDASAHGVPGAADVDALSVVDTDTFYLSFWTATTLPDVGLVAPHDIVLYDAGTWSVFFDGSDVGLTGTGENVDGFVILGAMQVAVSTDGSPDVGLPGIEADEDLLLCTGSFGSATTCTWSYYFDGSDIGLTLSAEDVDGAADTGGDLYLSTSGAFAVTGGTSGADEDVFRCNGGSRGEATTCTSTSLFFDGSALGVTDDLDAIDRP